MNEMEEILGLLRSIDARFKGVEERLKLKAVKAPKEVRWVYLDQKPIRATMRGKGWNQSDLARELKVGKDQVSVWLSGKQRFPVKRLAWLQQFVDIV
jgi:hypothetical protein